MKLDNLSSKEQSDTRKKTHPIAFQIVIIVVSLSLAINFFNGLCIILKNNNFIAFQNIYNLQIFNTCSGSYYNGLYIFLASIFALFLLVGFIKLKKWAWAAFMIWGGINLVTLLVSWYYDDPNYFGMLTNSLMVYILNLKIIKELYEI
jgi:hypothetical protein